MEESSDDRDAGEPPCKKRLIEDTSVLPKDDADDINQVSEDSEDNQDKDLPPDVDAYSQHFEYKLPEQVGTGKLSYEGKLLKWTEIGKFGYMRPVLKNVPCKEPSLRKNDISEFQLKKNLLDAVSSSSKLKKLSKTQIGVWNLISDYYDVLYMKRSYENGENLRFVYTLHILNHILKSRAKVIHHNSKNPDKEYRDQGFTRTTSVILVPFRHDCHRIISHLLSLLPGCVFMKKKSFETNYGPPPPTQQSKKKPEDHYKVFEGNINEDFVIGLKITNKSLEFYEKKEKFTLSDKKKFYSSDLIIASPLGLRQIMHQYDYDFLSSVEVLVIDRADVLMLQNPVHLLYVLKHFNLIPKQNHDWNILRVREYAVNGMAKYYRQNIVLSSVEHIFFETLIFQNICFNYSGYLISRTNVTSSAIRHILVPVKMCFRWFDTVNFETEIDDRFNFFVNKVLPDYKDKAMAQTMVYIPSYFDFVRLRNYFRETELSCVTICEFSKKGKVAQARDVFFKGHRHFMLYTERAHFYFRYRIKGIQHIVFYQPPTYPGFFLEMCNRLLDSNPRRELEEKSCTVIASKHDLLQVKHMVGLDEAKHMLKSKNKIFVKYTDE